LTGDAAAMVDCAEVAEALASLQQAQYVAASNRMTLPDVCFLPVPGAQARRMPSGNGDMKK